MKAAPSGMQWVAVGATCAAVAALIGYPRALPDPFRRGVDRAVDESARFWLWTWDEPADVLDDPNGEWGVCPVGIWPRIDGCGPAAVPASVVPAPAGTAPESRVPPPAAGEASGTTHTLPARLSLRLIGHCRRVSDVQSCLCLIRFLLLSVL